MAVTVTNSMGWRGNNSGKPGREVVREAERLLAGRTVESYITRRARVPAWTLIGLLGHGSRLDLTRLANSGARRGPGGIEPGTWSAAVVRLARDLLFLSLDDQMLVDLQRRFLVPLELAMLDGEVGPPSSPTELYEMVVDALEMPLSPEF